MAYAAGVAHRLLNWGTPLLVIGALLVYGSEKIAARFFQGKEKASLALKAAGGLIALVGALRMMTLI